MSDNEIDEIVDWQLRKQPRLCVRPMFQVIEYEMGHFARWNPETGWGELAIL